MPKPVITFETLREIAETASGMRNQEVWFVVTAGAQAGDPAMVVPKTEYQSPTDESVVIHCDPVDDPVSRVDYAQIGWSRDVPPVDLMKIHVPAVDPHPAGTYPADAVFWSVSAVEKFLVPYYASVYGDQGPAYANTVLDMLLRPSGPVDQQPFALAHLPSSEYVPMIETERATVPHLAALTPGGAQRVRVAAQGAAPRARTRGSRRT